MLTCTVVFVTVGFEFSVVLYGMMVGFLGLSGFLGFRFNVSWCFAWGLPPF